MPTLDTTRRGAPALQRSTQVHLVGAVGKRPGLGLRGRSSITAAALIVRNLASKLAYYLELALDSGVQPREIAEIITALAFYGGWPNAISALPVAKDVFEKRPQQRDSASLD
jgi:4-carboxymuconolactone decarboxylase